MRLSFDDGPSEYTAELLDALAEHRELATFFLVGSNVAELPALAQRIVREGHAVGNHSWDHPRLTRLDDAALAAQLDRTSDAIESATGTRPALFRPPYGDIDARVEAAARERGMQTMLWSVNPKDWTLPGAAAIAEAIRLAPADSIVLLHDGRGERRQTVEAVRLGLSARAAAEAGR